MGESKARSKSVIAGRYGARLLVLLLFFALIPLAAGVIVTQNTSYASTPLNCQPGVQNQYPETATPGQEIAIVTTVTSSCVGPDVVVTQVVVNILPLNSAEILSTALASPAVNTVTAPAKAGPWSLVVQVFWNGYPTSGNFETFQTTITIKIK